jgi:hypothetical protein
MEQPVFPVCAEASSGSLGIEWLLFVLGVWQGEVRGF